MGIFIGIIGVIIIVILYRNEKKTQQRIKERGYISGRDIDKASNI